MLIYTKEYNTLNEIYNNRNNTALVTVEGSYGSGKSCFVKHFLEDKKAQILTIKQRTDWEMLQPVLQAIQNFNLESSNELVSETNLPLESYLNKQLLDITISVDDLVLYIDDITSRENNELLAFLKDFLHFFLGLENDNKVFIVVEASTDKLSNEARDFLASIKSVCPRKNQILLEQIYRDELKLYFYSLFYEPISIGKTELTDILKASFFNPLLIQRLVSYLKDKKIIDFEESYERWVCRKIDVKITSNYFKDYIQSRYDALDNTLKDILKKAAYTGFEIDTKLLENPIGILSAEQQLSYIERLSKLIYKEVDCYQFENDEVYQVIEECADKNERNQWHRIIGEYLETCLPVSNKDVEFISLYKIAYHFQLGEDYKKALNYYIKCISKSQQTLDFAGCISIGERIMELNKVVSVNFFTLQFFWYTLAISYQMTAQYDKASTYYKLLLDQSFSYYERDYLSYNYGYSLYNAGDTDSAEKILLNLKEEIKKEESKKGLLIESLTILSGIYDQLGNHGQSQRFYSQAVDLSSECKNQTKYYRLLRSSNMFLTSELSIPQIERAYNYFHEQKFPFEEAFAAHNLATEYLFMLDFDKAEMYLDRSEKIFESYCSNNICFPLNALGNFFAYKKDYENALKFYEKALFYSFDNFISIVLKLNISQCHYKLGNVELSQTVMKEAEQMIESGGSDLYVQFRNFHFIKAMKQLDNNNIAETLFHLNQAYYYEVEKMNYHYYDTLIAKMILYVGKLSSKDCEKKYKKYENSILKGHIQVLYEEHVLWANLEFWGV